MRKPREVNDVRALTERNQRLELLSDVGVALAGSFDIRAILETTHDAARRLVASPAVDLLYAGCESINSRPMWYPEQPSDAGLTAPERDEILALGNELPAARPGESRQCRPIEYQGERLGYLFVARSEHPDADAEAETERLLSVLTLQAATALRNIHSTQQRIHFERLAAIGRMIGSVVHDFRSPLTALRGYAGMLTNLKLDDGERAAYGRYVIEECDRLDHLVSELLEFTRGGNFELEPASVPARPFIEAIATRLRAHYGSKGIRVELDLGHLEDDELFADKERLERAIWNVATNACQAIPDGGTVRIRADRRENSLALAIEDDGAGIPAEVRHRIFEPFFSFGKSEGVGLGMMIARKIAEDHGGSIAVESDEGRGTTVRFEIPMAVSDEAETVGASSKSAE
jgi:signal transduction histidine kinase